MIETARPTFFNLPPAKQQKVIEAALAEFADKGYSPASINVMVSTSGIAKGSIYQYFKDKKGIFLYLFEYGISLVRRTLVQVKDDTEAEDFFTRLEKSLLAGIDFIHRHPRIYGIYLKILFDQHVPQREELLKAVRQFAAEYLQSLVRRGLTRGEIRADLPVPAATFLLDALLDRFLQAVCVPSLDVSLGLDRAAPGEIRQRIRELVELLRAGLGA
jgi:TetR/AcrR family transcriptional regulator